MYLNQLANDKCVRARSPLMKSPSSRYKGGIGVTSVTIKSSISCSVIQLALMPQMYVRHIDFHFSCLVKIQVLPNLCPTIVMPILSCLVGIAIWIQFERL